jgi:hypothetical protein
MMLETVAGQPVREREQEVVMIVVMRAEEPVGLRHQVAMELQLLRRHLQVLRRIGNHIQMDGNRGAARVEVDPLEVATRVHRRIDQGVVGHRLERRGVTGPGERLERRAE